MQSNTPQLRFPEFNEKWEIYKLGTLLNFKNGINASKEQYGKGIKFVNVLDILNNHFITYDKIVGSVDIDNKTLENNSVEYGDILFQRSSETREEAGTANVYLDREKKATFGGFIIRGKKIGDYDPVFMNKLLKTSLARKEIISRAGGSTRYNVGQDTLSEVEIRMPSISEQQKIASFFSLLDQKIEKQQEKIEQLEFFKKGMMQKIFSQEIRFKDKNGQEFPDWSINKFNKVIQSKTKGTEANYTEYGNLLLHNEYLEFNKNALYVSNEKNVESTDILILWDGSQAGNVYTGYTGVLGSTFAAIKLKSGYSNIFIAQQLKFRLGEIKKAWREGSGVPHVSKDFFRLFNIYLPCYQEQQKIADFLFTLDTKIEKETGKLELLKETKKGLMQKMFI